MKNLQLVTVAAKKDSITPAEIEQNILQIEETFRRNNVKYITEGITFLILIFIGAAFVFRAVRRQFILQQQQQNFMMAVTHELKTPISVAKLNLETLQKHQLDSEKQQKIIRMTLQETARLNTLINNILVSSQLEGGGYFFTKEELDFTSLVRDSIRDARSRYPERIFLENIEADIEITGDSLLLHLMISNLVENAVKYSSKEKPIAFRLSKINHTVELNILDEGIGIDDTEKKKVFEKFYRIGSEATRKTQGTGLGLYLCRKIAEDHNADILVTNNQPEGSIFTVRFQL
jgi:signal transduction histidine kinase